MRSVVVTLLVALAGCGSVQRSTRVGVVYGARDASRAFVTVERWSTVTEVMDDADGEPVRHDGLLEATLFEVRADGAVTRRLHADSWLDVIGWDQVHDVVWVSRQGDGRTFGLTRGGAEAAAPARLWARLDGDLVELRGPDADATTSFWDLATGARSAATTPWPLSSQPAFDPGTMTLAGCVVDRGGIEVVAIDLAALFAMRGDALRRTRLEVEAGPAFTCALSPDAGMVVVVRPTALAVIATWSGAAIATLPLPHPIAPYGVFAGAARVVLPGTAGVAVVVDLASRRIDELAPSCCAQVARVAATGAVIANREGRERGLLIAADGIATPLGSRAAVDFAAATGLAPWPLAGPASKLAPLGVDAVVAAGVERGQVVVQLARRDRVLARVTLDDRTP